MIKLNLNLLKDVNGGLPNANENAPGGTNVGFAVGNDGMAVCANGTLTTITPTAAPSIGILNAFAGVEPSNPVDRILAGQFGTLYCGY